MVFLSGTCGACFREGVGGDKKEGGIPVRSKRYVENERFLVSEMKKLG